MGEACSEMKMNHEVLYDQAGIYDDKSFPIEISDRLLAGDNAIKVYRNHRNMTQKQLAWMASINMAYLSQIERGQLTGSIRTLQAIA